MSDTAGCPSVKRFASPEWRESLDRFVSITCEPIERTPVVDNVIDAANGDSKGATVPFPPSPIYI